MVTYWNQDPEAKSAFREVIWRKGDKECQAVNAHLNDELPAFLAWLAKPLATADFNRTRAVETGQGSTGQETISTTLWFWLGRQFNLSDDVVLEPCRGDFIQLDHLVIVPAGVFIVEAKT